MPRKKSAPKKSAPPKKAGGGGKRNGLPKGLELVLSKRGADAKARTAEEGVVVLAGSTIAPKLGTSGRAEERQALTAAGVLVKNGKGVRFARDHTFGSPSTAAALVLGRSSNGWTEWKTAEGKTLAEAVKR